MKASDRDLIARVAGAIAAGIAPVITNSNGGEGLVSEDFEMVRDDKGRSTDAFRDAALDRRQAVAEAAVDVAIRIIDAVDDRLSTANVEERVVAEHARRTP